jgi:predicted RND superfamily exporter protein
VEAKTDCPRVEPGARFRLAGGFAGLLSAVNEVVMRTEALVTLMAFLVVFLVCAISYRSILAGLFFMVPLVVSNYLTYALMGLRGIGLDVNTVPIVALGVGLGVDYGLYVVSRIEEEVRARGDLAEAIVIAMATSGKAVVVTAMTMVAGVVFWTFSFLRFQADMGLLLVFWMTMSMVGSLLLLPTLIWIFRPKFVMNRMKTI